MSRRCEWLRVQPPANQGIKPSLTCPLSSLYTFPPDLSFVILYISPDVAASTNFRFHIRDASPWLPRISKRTNTTTFSTRSNPATTEMATRAVTREHANRQDTLNDYWLKRTGILNLRMSQEIVNFNTD